MVPRTKPYRVTASRDSLDPSAGKAIRHSFQRACAIAHGVGANMSANQLMQLVMEKGLPPLEEREAILAARLAEPASVITKEEIQRRLGDNTGTIPSREKSRG